MTKKVISELLEKELSSRVASHEDYPILDNLSLEEREGLTKWDVFIKGLVAKALRGEGKAQTELLDRLFGKAPQHITSEVNIKNYHTFLSDLADLDDPQPKKKLPKPKPKVIDVVAEPIEKKDLLDDFGLS